MKSGVLFVCLVFSVGVFAQEENLSCRNKVRLRGLALRASILKAKLFKKRYVIKTANLAWDQSESLYIDSRIECEEHLINLNAIKTTLDKSILSL